MSRCKTLLLLIVAPLTLSCSSKVKSSSGSCEAMTRFECMESTTCTLTLSTTPNVYTCATSAGCGAGVSQNDLQGKEDGHVACASIEGCVATPGECYCSCRGNGMTLLEDGPEAPECDCACAGGKPASCVPSVTP